MTRKWVWPVIVAGVLVVGLACAGYYWTASRVARAAAVSIATGQDGQVASAIGDLGADPFWAQQLGSPRPDDLIVQSASGPLEPSSHLTFGFMLRNRRNSDTPPVGLSVDVEFTTRGWVVVGYGSVGG